MHQAIQAPCSVGWIEAGARKVIDYVRSDLQRDVASSEAIGDIAELRLDDLSSPTGQSATPIVVRVIDSTTSADFCASVTHNLQKSNGQSATPLSPSPMAHEYLLVGPHVGGLQRDSSG